MSALSHQIMDEMLSHAYEKWADRQTAGLVEKPESLETEGAKKLNATS